MTLRLQTRFMSLMVSLCAVFTVGVFAIRSEQRRSLDRLLGVQRNAADATLDVVIESRRAQPRSFARDYSLWSEMITFVETGDRAWAAQNIDAGLATFRAQGAWVFDARMYPVYAADSFEDAMFPLPVTLARLRHRVLNGRDWFARFFAPTEHGVAELYVAPIQPSDDVTRKSQPRGYFVVAKLWDEAELRTVGAMVGGTMSVEPAPETESAREHVEDASSHAGDGVVVRRTLVGIDGVDIARLCLALNSPFILAARTDVDRLLITCATFGTFVVVLVFIFFMRWIHKPLRRIVGALRDDSASGLHRVQSLAQEYEALCGLIEHSIKHKTQLTVEVEERRRVEAELVRERDRAERASVAKGQFLANMSHEIRTPLNGVLGMARLLIDTQLNEEQRDLASTIRSSGEALLGVLNDILDFSKIEAGKLTIEAVQFSPRRILDETVQLFAAAAQGKDLALFTDLDSSLPSLVCGDPLRMRQIVSNLVGNAIKFTHGGHVVVRAAEIAREGHDVTLEIAVEDTGIGIPADFVNQLFDAFSQADGTMSRRFGGTGLGLAISKRLVNLMGGRIDVKSVEHRGTTFTFSMRCLSLPEVAVAPARAGLCGRVALVLDACGVRRAVISKRLRELGLEVVVVDAAASGALASLATEPFHLAMIAIESDQSFALAAISSIASSSPQTRCVALAPFGTRLDISHPGSQHVAATIPLPWSSDMLEQRITDLFAVPNPRQAQPAPQSSEEFAERGPLVLLAEDNPVNQKVAKLMLERLGIVCEVVSNGRLAVAAVARDPYDLVLMDCQMPDMDGYEATAVLREREEAGAPRVTIVAMTANSMASDRLRCLNAGMDDYIAKPVDFDTLRTTLAKYLPIEIPSDA